MRFIKTFESLIQESIKDDLKEFCEINLAYLLDDDYTVMITRRDNLPVFSLQHKPGHLIHFYRWTGNFKADFSWNEIEDQFIPFIQRLSNEYTFVECHIDYGAATKYVVSLESLLNNEVPKERLIDRILVIVKEE
jgi:hypothetical protein